MKKAFRIKARNSNQFRIVSENVIDAYATINYERGNWVLVPSNENSVIVNSAAITDFYSLQKYDIIEVGNTKFYWSDYLIEENNQTLYKKDFISYHGRINKSNFRALSLLFIGLIPIIYLSPGLILLGKRERNPKPNEDIELIQTIAPFIHTIGFSILFLLCIIVSIKRMRDTGKNLVNLLIPIWNLKLLLFNDSKQITYE